MVRPVEVTRVERRKAAAVVWPTVGETSVQAELYCTRCQGATPQGARIRPRCATGPPTRLMAPLGAISRCSDWLFRGAAGPGRLAPAGTYLTAHGRLFQLLLRRLDEGRQVLVDGLDVTDDLAYDAADRLDLQRDRTDADEHRADGEADVVQQIRHRHQVAGDD